MKTYRVMHLRMSRGNMVDECVKSFTSYHDAYALAISIEAKGMGFVWIQERD